MAISRVRGIGVADIASTSTLALNFFNFSLCSTPNLCSSSTIIKPKSLKATSSESNLWVPMTISTPPLARPANVSLISLLDAKRDRAETVIGNPL